MRKAPGWTSPGNWTLFVASDGLQAWPSGHSASSRAEAQNLRPAVPRVAHRMRGSWRGRMPKGKTPCHNVIDESIDKTVAN